ncbi:MAG: lipopolysaccharide biosynthesis protein [Candidatus Limnocylindrales bacterium]
MLARQYAITTAAQVIQTLLAVVALFALARVLAPAGFGQVVLLTTAVTLGTIAASAGLQAAVLILAARDPSLRPALHGLAVVASALAGGALVITAILLGSPLQRVVALEPAIVIMTAARLGPAMYSALMSAALGGAGKIGRLALVNVVNGALGLLAPIGAWVGGGSLAGAVAGALAASALVAVCAFGAARVLGLALPSPILWTKAVHLGLPLHIGTVAYWIMLRADAFVVNAVVGGGTVGLYALALSLSERVSFLATPLYNATAWRVSGGDPPTSLSVALLVARIEIAFAVILAAAAWLGGPVAIGLLAGTAYVAAAGPTTILVVGATLLPVWASIGLYLASQMDGAWFTARTQVVVAVLAVAGYLLLVPVWGMYGAALVSTSAYVLLVAMGITEIRRRQPFPLSSLLPRRVDVAAARALLRRRGSPGS